MTGDLYICNYCDRRCTPLRSITRLPVKDAYSLAEVLSQNAGNSSTSFSRFTEKDFDGYYKKRKRTEKWLYNSFIEIGGRPKKEQPLYLVLGESRYLEAWYENGIKTKLLLKDINPEDISFTYGDSMSKMDSEDRTHPFNKESLFEYILKYNSNIGSFIKELDKQNEY